MSDETAAGLPEEPEFSDLESEYAIMGELGRGGSAIVFRARDRELGREVAIKVVRPRHAAGDDESLQRLAREARTVAGLQHPGIVTVHAVKRLRDGGLALVMQLVPGRTLKSVIVNDGALAPDVAERYVRDIAAALAYAHAHGVVHRDVKPENIFIDSASGRAMLSDFGIAHSAEFDSRLTMTGTAIGTPAYMSPEQIDGKTTDARSDVYSLGLVAWEMLTGERPWEGETLYNVIYRQKHDDLPPIDAIRTGVPLRLQYIVERCLQKRPAARWAGADGLLAHMNASVLPSDWGQWQDAHRKRTARELAAQSGGAQGAKGAGGLLGAALATIRFRRRETGEGDATASFAAPPHGADVGASVTPGASGRYRTDPGARDTEVDDVDPTPSWSREAITERSFGGKRSRLAAAAAVLLLLTVAGIATLRNRDDIAPLREPVETVTDAGTIQVPVTLPPIDSAPSVTAPAGYDTVSGVPLGRAASDTVLTADTAIVSSSAGALALDAPRAAPTRPIVPPAPIARPGAGAPLSTAPALASALPNPPPLASATLSGSASGTSGNASGEAGGASGDASGTVVRSTEDRAIIAAGGRHTCTLDSGRVYCWGANDRGQLGDGELESRATADDVVGDLEFVQLSAGIAHTCGVTRGGEAYCWGNDERGQLGDATTTSRSAPVRVASNLTFRLVRAGLSHSCGISASGMIACWGANDNGQLGDGTTTAHSSPALVDTRVRFISVTAGWNHSCGIATDGTAFCWGDNSAGQLGDGSKSRRIAPVPVLGGVRFTSLAAGGSHTCGVSEAGEAYCWGRNNFGQLGTGEAADHANPVKVSTTMRFASVSVGASHSCARTRSFGAFCWGRNVYGQVGDGTTVDRTLPVRVAGGLPFTSISATGAHSCGVATDGSTSCWGYNVEGQLGDGTRNHRARPMRVSIPVR